MNGKCGLSLLRKCHSHNTQELVWAAERVKIRSGKTNYWFIEHIKIMIRFKDKTVSLTKHLTITALFYFQYFFMNSPFILPKRIFYLSANHNRVHRSTWVNPLTWKFATSYLRQREHMWQIWLFSCSNYIAVTSSTKLIVNRAIPRAITWKSTT